MRVGMLNCLSVMTVQVGMNMRTEEWNCKFLERWCVWMFDSTAVELWPEGKGGKGSIICGSTGRACPPVVQKTEISDPLVCAQWCEP